GFTLIELLIITVLLIAASVLFFVQKESVEVVARDSQRKTSINAMYYGLEEVFYKQNKYYPRNIDSSVLPSVDPELFKDPSGNAIGTSGSDYSYEPFDCNGNKCKKYNLSTRLENEDTYKKTSNN